MESVFLNNLERLFGKNFRNIPLISEALHETDDLNRALAEVGDSVLNLIVKKVAYEHKKDPTYIDKARQKFAEKEANKKMLNQDCVFTTFLREENYTKSPSSGVGKEKADRFVEGLIGAIYFSKGYEKAKVFTLEILLTNDEFLNEFPELQMQKMNFGYNT